MQQTNEPISLPVFATHFSMTGNLDSEAYPSKRNESGSSPQTATMPPNQICVAPSMPCRMTSDRWSSFTFGAS